MEIQDKGAGLNGLVIVRHNTLVIVPVVFIVLIVKIAGLVRIVLRKTRELNFWPLAQNEGRQIFLLEIESKPNRAF
jgi:hypothetical protein